LLRDIALAVYSKLRRLHYGRQPFLLAEKVQTRRMLFEPAAILSPLPPSVAGSSPARMAHVCYAWSDDGQWLVSVLTDSVGELLETFAEPTQSTIEGTFASTIVQWVDVLRRTGHVEWTIVLAKLGVMTQTDFQAWMTNFSTKAHDHVLSDVTLVALRFVPQLQVLTTLSEGRVEVASKHSTLFFPAVPPVYKLDLNCVPPVVSAFVSSTVANGGSLWPATYLVALYQQFSLLSCQLP
jgi:hypothetical protein